MFKTATSDTYIIFGEAKIEDLSAQAQETAAQQFNLQKEPNIMENAPEQIIEEEDEDEEDEDEEIDAEGIEEKDIELVVQQAGCSRNKAIKSLVKCDKDIVSAIMDLTM